MILVLPTFSVLYVSKRLFSIFFSNTQNKFLSIGGNPFGDCVNRRQLLLRTCIEPRRVS